MSQHYITSENKSVPKRINRRGQEQNIGNNNGSSSSRNSSRIVPKAKSIRLSRVRRYLRLYSRSTAISTLAVLACATTIEFILEKIFELAKRVAHLDRKGKIHNRHIYLAIQSTDWLRRLFHKSIIPGSGVAPSTANSVEANSFATNPQVSPPTDENDEGQHQ